MKNAFVIVTLAGLFSGCAAAGGPGFVVTPPVVQATPAPDVSDLEAEASEQAERQGEAALAKLPKVELTKDMLYSLMQAELQFRNGVWEQPYATMLELARKTRDPRLARRAAEMARTARQEVQTMAAVTLWRELAPDSGEAQGSWLALAISAGRLSEAEAFINERVAAVAPESRGVLLYEAVQYLARSRDKAQANGVIERVLAPYHDMFEARVLLAHQANQRGDSAAALAHAQAAVALKPDSESAMLVLAEATSNKDAVSALLAGFLARHPGSVTLRSAYGRHLIANKQYEAGRTEFLEVLKQRPDNAGALYALGYVSTQLNDTADAESYFSRFIEAHDKNPSDEREPGRVLLILAQLAEARGDLAAARAWLERAVDSQSDSAFNAQVRLAQFTAREGNLMGARALLSVVKPMDASQQAQLVLAEGQMLRDAGHVLAAYELMQEGLKAHPDDPDLLYDFALVAERIGQLDVMEQSLRTVMEKAPDNHHAYNALGYSLADRNERLPEAMALVAKALQMAPSDPFILDSMGWVYYRMGKLNEAEAHLRRAYALRSDLEIAVHLGEVLWQKGQRADAQKLWREVSAKDPGNGALKSTLARLQLSL